MGYYRTRDLLKVPSLVSMLRVPLAFVFVWFLDRPIVALMILGVAGLTDVFDGWYARRFGQVTATGTVVDPLTDKFFVLVVVVSLVLSKQLDAIAVLMLTTREVGELPLVVWLSVSRRARRSRKDHPSANVVGKLATVLQFVCISAALFSSPHLPMLLWVAASGGAVAALAYWWRAIVIYRKE